MSRSKKSGLRRKGKIWHIEKRCPYTPNGWLRCSTGKTSFREAQEVLDDKWAQVKEEARRRELAIYCFKESAFRYIEEIAHKSSATDRARHCDQIISVVGDLPLHQIHDGTLKAFIDHELARGLSPKSINNALDVVAAILNRAAKVWRDEQGRPWLRQAPAKISRLPVKGQQKRPYALSWEEQDRLLRELPSHQQEALLLAVNTGCREQELLGLKWAWEIKLPGMERSAFVLPAEKTKTGVERVVVLNHIAQSVIESRRGKHEEFVLSYKGRRIGKLNTTAWRRAWKRAGLPMNRGICRGVHNLRHTCGRRLRAVGIPLETRKAILGHANGDITTRYSAAELKELIDAVEAITQREKTSSPNLLVIARENVGKLSEKNKGLTEKVG